MKKRKCSYKFFLALMIAGLWPGASVLAQQYEKSQDLKKVYPASEKTTIQIINKYGNIHVLPWEKDSVSFEISIRVQSSKQSKVEKTFENIRIDFSESIYYMIAQTVFGNQKNAFWADVTDFANSMLNSGTTAQIDYKVYVPSGNEISVENKFGNIYMTDHEGKVILNLSNGDFRGGSFRQLELDHSFGNVTVDHLDFGLFNLSYSDFKLKTAGEIRITSKSSKPAIGSFKSMRLNSKRDTYFIDNAGLVNGEILFSYMTIHNLKGDLILTTNYGGVSIDHFGKEFSMMNVASNYTDISTICKGDFDYFLEVYYDQKTRMIYPQGQPAFTVTTINKESGEFLLSGQPGESTERVPRIKITLKGGSFNLVNQ